MVNNIVITGGSGFIGSHLVAELLRRGGYDITVIDLVKPKFETINFIEANISELSKFKSSLLKADTVIHLAAMVGVDNCRNRPEMVKKTNYEDTKNFVDLCVSSKVKRFIFSSSSEIYGNSKKLPYNENDRPEPISLYAKFKLEIEDYLAKRSDKISVGVVRFFNVYGPMQKEGFAVSNFIKAAITNVPIQIFGNGDQTRCFTYIDDAVTGIIKLLEYNKSPFEIVNIGNPTEISIKKLAEMVLVSVPGTRSVIQFHDYAKDGIREASLEIDRRVPDVSKAKGLLDFEAKVDLQSGLIRIIQSYATARS
ncbi:MAG: NAD-dependent epimerase/dehydratase family protein [Candidatus Doudnabacteria bacterium]